MCLCNNSSILEMNMYYNKNCELLARVLTNSLVSSVGNCSLTEPEIVINLVKNIVNDINKVNIGIKTQGVIVHQTPKVKFYYPDSKGYEKITEIGDLLLLSTNLNTGKKKALLLQAKKNDNIKKYNVDKYQQFLYAKWPVFNFVHHQDKYRRHVIGSDLFNAAKYLFINQKFQPLFYTAIPSIDSFCHFQLFISELISFIFGPNGKEYKDKPHHNNKNWDRVINDILDYCKDKKIASGKNKHDRCVFSMLCSELDNKETVLGKYLKSSDCVIPPISYLKEKENDGRWMSIIEFIVDEKTIES